MVDREIRNFAFLAIKAFCGFIMSVSAVFTFYTLGPSLETRWWPVVDKLKILSIEPTPDGATRIRAGFTKLRDCEYIGISWFVGDRKAGFDRVSVVLQREPGDTGSPNRPLGYQRAGPWIIGVSPADLKSQSFAQLTHRCHPFWMTTTDFYP